MDATTGSVPQVSSNGRSSGALSAASLSATEKQARFAYRMAKDAIVDSCTLYWPDDGSGMWFALLRRYDERKAQRDLSEAVEFLEQAGLLERHPQSCSLVRIKDPDTVAKRQKDPRSLIAEFHFGPPSLPVPRTLPEAPSAPETAEISQVHSAAVVADPSEALLREAHALLNRLRGSREFKLYIDPESIFGTQVHAWLTKYAEARLGRAFASPEAPEKRDAVVFRPQSWGLGFRPESDESWQASEAILRAGGE